MRARTALPQREVRRSFALGLVNGAVFEFADRLIDPPLVIAWFVSQLTGSNLLIGLAAPLGVACWLLPQVFVSARIQRMTYKMPSYVLGAVTRTAAWLLLTAGVWFMEDPGLLLLVFFALYIISHLASGLGGLAFFDVIAKTIPVRQRGSFFAWRQLLGGLLALAAGWIIAVVLNAPGLPFPRGHAVLFLLYAVAIIPAMGAFIMIREPPGTAAKALVRPNQHLHRAREVLTQDPALRRFMLIRMAMGLADIAVPFYGIYARNVLGAPEAMAGLYVAVRAGAALLFNLPWGRLSDRNGNRLVLRLAALGSGCLAFFALALVVGVELFQLRGAWLPYLLLPVFFLDGALRPTQMLVGSNFLIELAPEEERPLYLGVGNTLFGIVVLLSGLGGLVVDVTGFAGLFVVTLSLYMAAFFGTGALPEPRTRALADGGMA